VISFRNIYNWLGVKYAPPGTLLYSLDKGARRCWRRLFGLSVPQTVKHQLKKTPLTIAFWMSGGIGDHLIAARFIRDLMTEIGDVPFDVYAQKPAVAQWILSSFPSFNACYGENYATYSSALESYPWVFRLFSFIDVKHGRRPSLQVTDRATERLLAIAKAVHDYNSKLEMLIDQHPRLDGYLGEVAVRHEFNRMTMQQGVAGIHYGGDVLSLKETGSVLQKYGLAGLTYMTIHNGFDADFRIGQEMVGGVSTKTYPHFAKVLSILRKVWPDLCFVQVGVQTSVPIEGIDVNLVDKTSLQECAEILRHSILHIDGESGLVHLAACLNVKSCVVFGPTPVDFFGYGQNINVPPSFCGNCWWMTADWLRNCPRGFNEARCLSEQDPQVIVDKIVAELRQNKSVLENVTA